MFCCSFRKYSGNVWLYFLIQNTNCGTDFDFPYLQSRENEERRDDKAEGRSAVFGFV